MEKEIFVEKMNVILEFTEEQEALRKVISSISDGYAVVTMGDSLALALIDSIENAMNIKGDEWLAWWLWEDVDKIIYDKDKEIKVETIEELYDFLASLQ